MASPRVQRGRATEELVARWFREHGWTGAERQPAGLPGVDVTGMPGLACEVKARRSFNMTGWLKQAAAREGLPFVVVRPDGYGPERIAGWPVVIRLDALTTLLQAYEFEGHLS